MHITPTQQVSTPPVEVAVIVGSTREGRRVRVVADWVVSNARRADVALRTVDLADFDVPVRFSFEPGPGVAALRTELARGREAELEVAG